MRHLKNSSTRPASILAGFLLAVLAVSQLLTPADAFAATKKSAAGSLPTYDKKTQRWSEPAIAEEGYGLVGTLLRNGPLPFFTRLTNPDDYNQAVLKFQASEKCTRNVAQGNMDAYFENPNDWAYQRMVEQNGGYKRDYGEPPDTKQVALTVTWGLGISYILSNLVLDLVSCCAVLL